MNPEKLENLDTIEANQAIALRMMHEAAAQGDSIAGMAAELDRLAEPFFIDDWDDMEY